MELNEILTKLKDEYNDCIDNMCLATTKDELELILRKQESLQKQICSITDAILKERDDSRKTETEKKEDARKEEAAKNEKKKGRWQLALEAAGIVLPIGASWAMSNKVLKFEETGVVRSKTSSVVQSFMRMFRK